MEVSMSHALPIPLPAILAGPAVSARSPEQQQFDFWLGDWDVHDGKGQRLGHNRIEALLGGTVLQEHWDDGLGSSGTSLNAYQPARKLWTQHWVDSTGGALDLEGRLEGTSMVLKGVKEGPKGRVIDRIIWTPLPDGRVRQLWDRSMDGGLSWSLVFDGYYTRINHSKGSPS